MSVILSRPQYIDKPKNDVSNQSYRSWIPQWGQFVHRVVTACVQNDGTYHTFDHWNNIYDTLVYWESFSWLTSVGTTRNTVNRLGWCRIGLAVLILNAAGAGLIGRPAVISGRYNKCHSLQLQNHYAHFPPLQHTHIHARHSYAELVMGNDHGFRGIVCWPWQEESCVIG